MDHPPIPAVSVDYGFINCRTFEETCTLMEIYGQVLKTADPLELHEACVAGDLFQFASGYVRMEKRWRSLMGNFYPLKEVVESGSEVRVCRRCCRDFGDSLVDFLIDSVLGRCDCRPEVAV